MKIIRGMSNRGLAVLTSAILALGLHLLAEGLLDFRQMLGRLDSIGNQAAVPYGDELSGLVVGSDESAPPGGWKVVIWADNRHCQLINPSFGSILESVEVVVFPSDAEASECMTRAGFTRQGSSDVGELLRQRAQNGFVLAGPDGFATYSSRDVHDLTRVRQILELAM